MQLTNKLGLPAPLVKAVSRPRPVYGPKTVSVTTLARPAQINGLEHLHDEEITEDASDRIWALMGSLLHDVLERHAEGLEDTIAEQRLDIQVSGWTVTGKYDLSEFILDGIMLSDWKFTSIYSLKENEPVKPEWEAQINCYAELVRQAGRGVHMAQIVVIGRDWSKLRAKRESDYPQKAVIVKPVNLWGSSRVLRYLTEKVKLYEAALKGDWPECSPEERWAKPTQFALMKKGQKRAVKLYDSFAAAERNRGAAHYIQKRPGESVRCASYCPVSSFCPQWAKLNQNNKQTKGEENHEGASEEI